MQKLDDTRPIPQDGLTKAQLIAEVRQCKIAINMLIEEVETLKRQTRSKK